MVTNPLVSICCITFNHALYIRQCLDGFIMQKTNFPIEILIHDDASTDGTADIIREYEQKYPEIIKPIYQAENQYSKGIPISKIFNFPRIKGKYFALCEGDDYWIDEYKLQKQIDFLENNIDFSICFHSVKVYNEEKCEFIASLQPDVPDITDIYAISKGNYISTPSVVYRCNKSVFDDYYGLPSLLIGDYILHMLFAKCGKIKKLNEDMAVYRYSNNSTWGKKPNEYRYSNWLKALAILIFYFRDDQSVCALLVDQYRIYSVRLYPNIHNDFYYNELEKLKKSRSWCITKPLRSLSRFFNKLSVGFKTIHQNEALK